MDITKRQIEIIEAAGKLLTAGGVANLTTNKLAKELGFSEAALYRHFESKNAIINALLLYLAELMDAYLTEITNLDKPADELLSLVFLKQVDFFKENTHFLMAIFSNGLWEKNEKIKSSIRTVMAVKKKHLNIIFTKGVESNTFIKTIEKSSMIHITMGTFRFILLQWKMNNFKMDISTKGDFMIQELNTIFVNKPKT